MTTPRLLPIGLILAFLATFAAAQNPGAPSPSQSAATITGRVLNAASGLYLNNARVSIPGTTLTALTDQTGTYRLLNVPPGRLTVEAFYTGLDTQQVPVDIAAGQSREQDFSLTSSGIVTLDKFTVKGAADLETIATNEQRFAPNIKLVAAPGENEFVA